MRTLINKKTLIVLIFLLGVFLRFYKILDFPIQLNHDEISQLYDGLSLAQTAKDVYGNFLPTIIPSVQDYKSPFYTYITSLLSLVVGGGELTIKLPGAVFGSLIVLVVYFFVLNLLKDSKAALTSSFFTAIAPFEIFFSRKSFENVAGIFFMILGFTMLLKVVNKQISTKMLFIASILIAASAYTYFSHAILIPLLLLTFVLIYKEFFLSNLKKVLLPLILLIVLLIPILVIVIANPNARYRSQTVFITQDINLGRNIDYAKSSNFLSSLYGRNKAILDFSFTRFLDQFNLKFIFSEGLDFTNQPSIGQGLLLFIQLPFLIIGVIYLIRLKNFRKEKSFILAWILLGMLPSGLTFEVHSPHRSIMAFTMLNIISAVGLSQVLNFLYRQNKKIYIKFSMSFLIAVFTINLLYFMHMYVLNFPNEKSQFIQYPFKQVAQFAWSQYINFDTIVFDPKFGKEAPIVGVGAHYYFAYYGNYSPAKFQKDYKIGSKPREVIFDKFSIREVYWPRDKELKNTLVIVSPWSVPLQDTAGYEVIKKFNFYDGTLAFYAIKL